MDLIYRCGKCGNERRQGDGLPEWKCAKCEAVYSKVPLAAFSVLTSGEIISGFDRLAVESNLRTRFRLSDSQIDEILAGRPKSLKRHLQQAKAEEIAESLVRAGVSASVEITNGYAATTGETDPSKERSLVKASVPPNQGELMPIAEPRRKEEEAVGKVYREEPLQPLGRPRVRLRPAVKIGAVVIAGIFGLMIIRWGTLSPCGALKQELHWNLTSKMLDSNGTNGSSWESFGSMIGVALGGKMIDAIVDGLPPHRCAIGLFRLTVLGEGPALPQASAGERASLAAPDQKQDMPLPWIVNHTTSPLDDSKSVTVVGQSNDTLRSRFGTTPKPNLIVRCKGGDLDIYLSAHLGLEGGIVSNNESQSIQVRFGDSAPRSWTMSFSTDGEALFFVNPQEVLNNLEDNARFVAAITPSDMGAQNVVFDLKGLHEHIPLVRSTCGKSRVSSR